MSSFGNGRAQRSTEKSLDALGVDFLDLWLLHWPSPDVPLEETLKAVDEVRERGLVRHIGVSNFPTRLVEQALQIAPIFANQVEYHPYLAQPALVEQAQRHDLLLEAYSPFAHGAVHDDAVLREIGEAHGKSAGQVALRWLLDQDNVVALPKASSSERRAENLDVFDFALSEDQRARIDALDRGMRTGDPGWAPAWD
jgi:diketogulonate reductase-like aldo/keto reductase